MSVLDPEYLLRVFLVFVRIGAVLVSAPFFSHASIPSRVKIFFSVLMAWAVAGMVDGPLPEHATHPLGLLLAVAIEAATGLALGFAGQFVFLALEFAGQILGFQMGLGMAQMVDPINGHSANPLARFLLLVLLVMFLLLDGHHHVLRALVGSFEVVPLAGAQVHATGPLLLAWTGEFFTTALRLAAPFTVTIFLVDVALGVFARVVPQADLFSLALPVKILIGIGLMVVFMQQFFPFLPSFIATVVDYMLATIEAFAP